MPGLLRVFALFALSIAFAAEARAAAPAPVIVLKNSGAPLGETPLDVAIGDRIEPGLYSLSSRKDASQARAEVYDDAGKRHLVVVLPTVAAGEQEFELSGPIKIQGDPAVRLSDDGPNVRIEVFTKPFTTHHVDLGAKPILYPLIGPTGEEVTRNYPMKRVEGEDRDHPHQRSFWFTHGKVNGVDFWSEQGKHGTIKETGRATVKTGFVAGVLRTTDDWLGPDGAKVCQDERCLRVYATKDARLLDYDVTIKATNGPVLFGDTKEGMFGLRVASSMDVNRKTGGKITNAEGLTDLAAWGKPSSWVDYTGPVKGETLGIAIMNHPKSFRYPTEWHVRDYGLFAANPFGWKDYGRKESGDFTLPAGESVQFRYRVVLHRGETPSANLPDLFRSYAEPLTLELK